MLKKYFISAGRILLLLFMVSNVALCDTLKIYENLVQCYRENNTTPFVGNSIQILLELIRKIENYYPTSIDIRILSVSLIHYLRIDGIQRAPGIHETEFITPYRPNGIMTPKFQLLLKLISNVPGNLNFDEILTPTELCTLHKLISSTVEPFKRGDEATTCTKLGINQNNDWSSADFVDKVKVYPNGQTYVILGSLSRCPIEMGVVRTMHYGSLSPGTVIASIAAALQPQLVAIKELFPAIQYSTNPQDNLETDQYYGTDELVRKLSQSVDVIDNIYASGLAGDLAEVCIYHAPYGMESVTVGLPGYWNDTLYPLIRYLPESYQLNWTMTESEILAGIDSFHLATHIRSLTNRVQRTRLSQVIEMFYSPRGLPNFSTESGNRNKRLKYFDGYQQDDEQPPFNYQRQRRPTEIMSQLYGAPEDFAGAYRGIYYDPDRYILGDNIDSACERKHILNRISKDRLKEQTYSFAQVLQYSTKTMTVDDSIIKSTCDLAVDKFFERSSELLDGLPDCSQIGSNYDRPNVDLTLIIDGSRTKYENLKLISYLSELMDVSSYGSIISVVHGTTGEFLVKPTNSVVNAFEQLRKYNEPYPTTLSLTESFTTILNSLSDHEDKKRRNKQIVGRSKVILVISQSQKIRDHDFNGAKRMLEGSFQQFTDLYFVFVTNDVKVFEEMTHQTTGSPLPRCNIINAPNIDPNTFTTSLLRVLRTIPKWMRVPDCNEYKISKIRTPGDPIDSDTIFSHFEYEEYISPNERISYKIDGRTLINVPELRIQFDSNDYGGITVCLTRNSKDYQCQSTIVIDPVQFNITTMANNCDSLKAATNAGEDICPPSLVFRVELDNSKIKCSDDCRYPDQVRYLVRLRNVQCGNHATNLVISSVVLIIMIMLNILVL